MPPDLEKHIQDIQVKIANIQTRSGTMAAVVATIVGITLPLINQTQTQHYFHIFPFALLISSFLLFYISYARGIASVDLSSVKVTIKGNTTEVTSREPYKPNNLEKIISLQYVRNMSNTIDISQRLEKVLLWRMALSQWAHSLFLTALLIDFLRSFYSPRTINGAVIVVLLGLFFTVISKYFIFYKVTGNLTVTMPINYQRQ